MIEGLIVDNFAGGGGASSGIAAAFGRPVDIAINHDAEAVAMHAANHPETVHICQSVWKADPQDVCAGRDVALAWFSPDCKHFSKAKGGKPVEKGIRDLAWVVVQWARRVAPRVIMLENVEEFRTWAPLDEHGIPIKGERPDRQISMLPILPLERKGKRKKLKPNGETFELWAGSLRKLGYKLEWRELRGCDYGAPTIRKRLFVIARRDGRPIVWPEPSHGPARAEPWRTAAEIIDWSLPCPSIFDRKKPLAENTLRRIAHGVKKFVLDAAQPFIVPVTNSTWSPNRADPFNRPLRTVTTAKGGEFALTIPYMVPLTHQGEPGRVYDPGKPLPTITAAHRGEIAAIVPTLIQAGYGERPGQAPRVPGLHKPLGTTVAGGGKSGLVAAFLAKHTTGGIGSDARAPAPTVTANGTENLKRQGGATPLGLVCAHIEQANGGPCNERLAGRRADVPLSTTTATGSQQRVIATHLTKLYGTARDGQPSAQPLATGPSGGDRGGGHLAQVETVLAPHIMTMRNSGTPYSAADRPTHTVTAGDAHQHLVAAFLAKYFGSAADGQSADESLHTVTAKPRFGLVTVTIAGEEWVIVDIGMRMLTPRELARAQGFPDSYKLAVICDRVLPSGRRVHGPLPIAAQIRMIGNSVNRDVAEALVAANCNEPTEEREQVAA